MTGRYQQRFGHEHNSAHVDSSLPLDETTLAQRLKEAGYVTGLVTVPKGSQRFSL